MKRKRYVIDSTVQWAIARRVLCHWGALFALFLGVNTLIHLLVAIPDYRFGDALRSGILDQITPICVMLILLPIFLRDTLRLSNRFAGPMYRLRTSLATLAAGVPMKPIKFRERDFWQDVADTFNQVLGRIQDLESQNRALELELRRLREVAGDPAAKSNASLASAVD